MIRNPLKKALKRIRNPLKKASTQDSYPFKKGLKKDRARFVSGPPETSQNGKNLSSARKLQAQGIQRAA